MQSISFPSGVTIPDPLSRLRRFLEYEYPYYDEFSDDAPSNVIPLDVFVAAGVNAFIGGAGAKRLRTVHIGMSTQCDPLLPAIAVNDRLKDADDTQPIIDVIAASCTVDSVLSAVGSKILHRKRRDAIPMLDSVMVEHCCERRDVRFLGESYVSDSNRKGALRSVISVVQQDLQDNDADLTTLQTSLSRLGWSLTTLRIHDILVWSQLERAGYYRS
jgi:hypothetical protein